MIVSATWEERRLCDDGGCTGLIGDDGLCRVCRRASQFWGDERRRGLHDDADEEDAVNGAAAVAASDDDGDERALCPDGSCTGVLDPDGRCKVCGKVDENRIGRRVRASAAAGEDDDDDDEGDDGSDDGDDDDDDALDIVERKLCPDGGCTGLVGPNGACSVCGRRAED